MITRYTLYPSWDIEHLSGLCGLKLYKTLEEAKAEKQYWEDSCRILCNKIMPPLHIYKIERLEDEDM